MPASASAVPGELDPAFSGDGKALTNFTAGPDDAVGLAIQADGMIAAGGVGGRGGRFGLARYDTNGALDPAFGGDGRVITNFTSGYDSAFDVALQDDGKIVAAGIAAGKGGRIALARYRVGGSLDPTFGGDGKVVTNFTAGADWAFGIALQPTDQKIVVAGRAGGRGGRFALARYDADGHLDPTFGGDGRVMADFTGGDDRADLLAVQEDGRIVAAGTANYFSRRARFAVARFDADGKLDPGFGGDGKVTTDFTDQFDGAFAVALQPTDQKIVVAGDAGGSVGVARYDVDGILDPAFGSQGKVMTNFTSGLDYADDVEIAADDRVVVAGAANLSGRDVKFALARYEADGDLDVTFSSDGKVTTNFTSGRDNAYNVGIQADGNIVVAGRAGGSGGRFALARYLGT